jgi:hypothetical protein
VNSHKKQKPQEFYIQPSNLFTEHGSEEVTQKEDLQYEPSISIAYSLSKPSLKLNEIKVPRILNFSSIKSRYQHIPI